MSIVQTSASRESSAIHPSLMHDKPVAADWSDAGPLDQLPEAAHDMMEQAMNRKRMEARRYLREEAHVHGEKYSKAESRVFTPEFVTELGKKNTARRMQRNPWLEAKAIGLDEEEGKEEMEPSAANVLSRHLSSRLRQGQPNLHG